MAKTTVQLSDGQPCEVRRLGIFELDVVGPTLVGPFTYKFKLANGESVEVEYDLNKITNPPQHPGVPENEIVEGTPQWHALLEWQTYKAAVQHEQKRLASAIGYVLEITKYIADHSIAHDDQQRIIDDADWQIVYEAALVPQLTYEVLAQTFKDHFSAHFDGKEVFDAMRSMEGGHGGYDSIRAWEIQAMTAMHMTEDIWSDLPLEERSRKVAALKLPKLIEALESDRSVKESKRETARQSAITKAGG